MWPLAIQWEPRTRHAAIWRQDISTDLRSNISILFRAPTRIGSGFYWVSGSGSGGFQRDVVYLCWPIAGLNGGGGEGVSCVVSANEYSCAHHLTWSPNKLWRSTSIFNLWSGSRQVKMVVPYKESNKEVRRFEELSWSLNLLWRDFKITFFSNAIFSMYDTPRSWSGFFRA